MGGFRFAVGVTESYTYWTTDSLIAYRWSYCFNPADHSHVYLHLSVLFSSGNLFKKFPAIVLLMLSPFPVSLPDAVTIGLTKSTISSTGKPDTTLPH